MLCRQQCLQVLQWSLLHHLCIIRARRTYSSDDGHPTVVVCVNGRRHLRLRCGTADRCILRDERWAREIQLNVKLSTNIGTYACSVVSPTLWNLLPCTFRSVENIN